MTIEWIFDLLDGKKGEQRIWNKKTGWKPKTEMVTEWIFDLLDDKKGETDHEGKKALRLVELTGTLLNEQIE